MMGEERGKHALQEGCDGKADLVELRTSMGYVPRSLAMVPEGWREAHLRDVASVDRHNLGFETAPDFAFDYISLSNVEPGRIVGPLEQMTFEKAPLRARRVVEFGDLLVSTVRPNLLGFAQVTEEYQNCIASTGFAVVTPKPEADSSYLFHYLFSHHMRSQFHSLVVGSNYPAINSSDLLKLKVCLPSVSEQRKIAEILSAWDQAIEKTEALLAAARTRKHGLIQILLTGKRRFSEFEGQAWREVRLGEVATIIVSNVDKKSKDKEWPVRLCNYTDVYKHDIIESNQKFMESTATLAQIQKFRLNADDVIITKDSEMESPNISPLNTGTPFKWRWAWRAADLPCWFSGRNLDRFAADGQRTLL